MCNLTQCYQFIREVAMVTFATPQQAVFVFTIFNSASSPVDMYRKAHALEFV